MAATKAPEPQASNDISSGWTWLLTTMVDSYDAINRYEHLRHMSDAELARHGIRREDIPHHLFEELYEKDKQH